MAIMGKYDGLSVQELRTKRGEVIQRARQINETAAKAGRDLTAEENANYTEAMKDQDEIRGLIELHQRKLDRQEQLDRLAKEMDEPIRGEPRHRPGDEPRGGNQPVEIRWKPKGAFEERRIHLGGRGPNDSEEYRKDFRSYLRNGMAGLQRSAIERLIERSGQSREERAASADSASDGGFLVAHTQFAAGILQAADDLLFFRQRASVTIVDKAGSLGIMSEETAPDDGDWTSELKTGSEDAAQKFGMRELVPHPLAKRAMISRKLLRVASIDIEAFVQRRLAYKMAVAQEKAYLTGNGSQRPLGIFVASNMGIPTTRDVATGNSATQISFDNLIRVKGSLKQAYQGRAAWIMHRDVMTHISLIKDGNGQYIWRPSLVDDEPDRILGKPVLLSEYAPNTIAAGAYVAVYGDFSMYQIVDSLSMEVQVIDQAEYKTNQNAYVLRYEGDGMPLNIGGGEAFARVRMA
jgi:HK97 family phage major capsid protein